VEKAQLGVHRDSTLDGCTCKENCGASILGGYLCDTCKTEDGCGRFSVGGRWDYCDYSGTPSWEAQSWTSKRDYYWSRITKNTQRLPDDEVANPLRTFVQSARTTMDNWMTEIPRGRKKIIHAIGSMCQIELNIGPDSPYTGLLGPGRQRGFIRMGNAVPYSMGTSPGLGFKFPRSGVHSGDFVALNSLGLDHGNNFFEHNQSNHIAPASGATLALAKTFEAASQCAYFIGISDLTKYSQDGTAHRNPKFPFKLFFTPNSAIQMDNSEKTADQAHAHMDAFPKGTKLYSAYACASPDGAEEDPARSCAGSTYLGDITTTSQCTTSSYGDRSFHVRHQRIEEDWQAKPEYFESGSFSAQQACGRSLKIDQEPVKCNLPDAMLDSDA